MHADRNYLPGKVKVINDLVRPFADFLAPHFVDARCGCGTGNGGDFWFRRKQRRKPGRSKFGLEGGGEIVLCSIDTTFLLDKGVYSLNKIHHGTCDVV